MVLQCLHSIFISFYFILLFYFLVENKTTSLGNLWGEMETSNVSLNRSSYIILVPTVSAWSAAWLKTASCVRSRVRVAAPQLHFYFRFAEDCSRSISSGPLPCRYCVTVKLNLNSFGADLVKRWAGPVWKCLNSCEANFLPCWTVGRRPQTSLKCPLFKMEHFWLHCIRARSGVKSCGISHQSLGF